MKPSPFSRILPCLLLLASSPIMLYSGDTPAPNSDSAESQRLITFTLRGATQYSWWKLGDTVRMNVSTGTVPEWLESLTGKVTDSLGTVVSEITVTRDTLLQDGWQWKPAEPGFYEVTFTYREKGANQPKTFTEPWTVKSMSDRSHTRTFQREKFTVAVAPTGPRPAAQRPAQFGFNCERFTDDIIAANLIGFSFGRFWFYWGGNGWEWADKTSAQLLLEPEKGKYQWEKYDEYIDIMRKNGFAVQAVIVNTPKWASTHPEKTQMDICVPGYAAWAPADMNDWSHAVRAIVTRYKDTIHQWELWNEPHLPGFSVFWRDTPEKFAELLKSGYETVKSVQPDSAVIIGGMTARYLPFYRELLKHGGGSYYDYLGIHGRMQVPDRFYDLDRAAGLKPRPWLNTECHAILIDSNGHVGAIPTESELALRLLQDHFLQIKKGAIQTAFFCPINNTNRFEMEVIPFARQEHYNIQPSGLFRRYPQIEPRLSAVVFRTFLDQVQGKLLYRGEIELPGNQKAVWFETGGKSLLFVWNEYEKAAPLAVELRSAITTSTRALDWEGRPLATTSLTLHPRRAYWLIDASSATLKNLPASDSILLSKEEREARQKKNYTGLSGTYQTRPLFATAQDPLPNESALIWHSAQWKPDTMEASKLPPTFRARFAMACHAQGLDLVVDVIGDTTHFQQSKPGEYWSGDSVQFAIDTEERGMSSGAMEFTMALTADGPILWKDRAPSLAGDLPARWTPGGQRVQFATISIEKRPDGSLRYKMHLDWNELYPLVWKEGKTLPFSILVNDNDGAGRLGWIEWSSGIGGEKDPSLYGKLKQASAP